MRRKLLLLPAFLLGSTSIYCTETLITRSGGGATGADGAVPSAHAEPTKFELISEGSFIGESEVISVEGAARVTVAVAISEKSNTAECRVNWVVPSGILASKRFDATMFSLRLHLDNRSSDMTMGPVVLPKLQIKCEDIVGKVEYAVYGIK